MILRRDRHRAHDAVGEIGRARHKKKILAGNSGIQHSQAPFERQVSDGAAPTAPKKR
jgi:hypothetical protein